MTTIEKETEMKKCDVMEPLCGRDATSGKAKYCVTHARWEKEKKDMSIPIRIQDSGRGCKWPNCKGKHDTDGYCSMHYNRNKRGKDMNTPKFNSSGYIRNDGYVDLYRPGHPNAWKDGHILEHTVVMVEKEGRPLEKGETVHHLNGQRDDNDPDNLELWTKPQPSGIRAEDAVKYSVEVLRRYAPELLAENKAK